MATAALRHLAPHAESKARATASAHTFCSQIRKFYSHLLYSQALIGHHGGVPVLVKLVKTGEDKGMAREVARLSRTHTRRSLAEPTFLIWQALC